MFGCFWQVLLKNALAATGKDSRSETTGMACETMQETGKEIQSKIERTDGVRKKGAKFFYFRSSRSQ